MPYYSAGSQIGCVNFVCSSMAAFNVNLSRTDARTLWEAQPKRLGSTPYQHLVSTSLFNNNPFMELWYVGLHVLGEHNLIKFANCSQCIRADLHFLVCPYNAVRSLCVGA